MINPKYRDIVESEERAQEVASEILKRGHVVLPDALTKECAEELNQFFAEHKGEINVHGIVAGDLPKRVKESEELFQFCVAIHKARSVLEGKEAKELKKEKQKVGFPYKDARGGAKTLETDYHFDGAYINIIYPIMLPEDQERHGGKLILFKNLRKKYPYYVAAFISRLLRHFKLFRKLYGYEEVVYQVGAFHIFFGDLSFHGVNPITGGERLVMTINSHW